MAVFTVKLKFKNLKKLADKINREFVNDELIKEFDNSVVGTSSGTGQIRRLIAAGVSPVAGFGRFGEYVNPENYPGRTTHTTSKTSKSGKVSKVTKRVWNKAKRPVNLFLSGEMLSYFGSTRKSGNTITVGLINPPPFVKVKAAANNLGTTRNGVGAVPRRRFIPQVGEVWAVSVMREAKRLFTFRMRQLLSK